VGSGSSSHGCPPSSNRHEGDLGSWTVSNGQIDQSKTLDLITLSGSTSVIGRGVIVHDIADPCDDSSTGARIAMGVIGIANEENNNARQDANPNNLVCKLQPTSYCPTCSGTVWFQDIGSSIKVTAQIDGLTPGTEHGFHIHTYGDITDVDFGLSLGGHYNPDDSDHGLPANPNRHEGDMGNINSYDSGSTAWYEFNNERISTMSAIVGRGVAVHELIDNGNGRGCGPTGNSGFRYATCVIGVASDDIVVPSTPIFVDIGFFDRDCEISDSIFSSYSFVTSDEYTFSPGTDSPLPPLSPSSSSSSDDDDSSSSSTSSSSDDDDNSSSSSNATILPVSMFLLLSSFAVLF